MKCVPTGKYPRKACVPVDVWVNGKHRYTPRGPTNCSNFTMAVVMDVINKDSTLKAKLKKKTWQDFTLPWNISGSASCLKKGPACALKTAGLGGEISPEQSKKGDFIQFWRPKFPNLGPSVILEHWIDKEGKAIPYSKTKAVGLKYISSNKSAKDPKTKKTTKGIGPRIECFRDSGCPAKACGTRKSTDCLLSRSQFHVGRLK